MNPISSSDAYFSAIRHRLLTRYRTTMSVMSINAPWALDAFTIPGPVLLVTVAKGTRSYAVYASTVRITRLLAISALIDATIKI